MEMAALVGAGIATWALRTSFIGAGSKWSLPRIAEELLENCRFAILAALAVAALGTGDGALPALPPVSWLAGAAAAGVAAYRLRSLGWTMAAGMGTVWLLGFLAGW